MRYHFGPFTLDARRRRLFRGDEVVPLAPKGIDTLLLLLERPDTIVEKDDLIERLWPDTVVTESNLTQHVFTLRKALGERGGESQFIATVPRRGYRFVGDVRKEEDPEKQTEAPAGRVGRFTMGLPDTLPAARLPLPVMALSPDGADLAYVARGVASTVLCRRALDRLDVDIIPGTDGASTPFWSPDGEWLGFAAHGRLWRIRRAGGTPQAVTDAPECRGATWTASGSIVFSPGPAEGLWIAPANGGQARPLTQVDFAAGERTHRWPAALPDGRVIFTVGSAGIASFDEAALAIVGVDGGTPESMLARASDPRPQPDGRVAFVRDGTVWTARLQGDDARPLLHLDGVAVESTGVGHFTLAANGLAVYMGGGRHPVTRQLAWTDGSGELRPLDIPPGEIEEPRLSPDGLRIAYGLRAGTSDLWIYDTRRRTCARVTSAGDNFGAIWTPDGDSLTFSSNRFGHAGIFVARADGSGDPELLVRSEFDLVPGSWSPDGRRLLYTEYHPETGADIWMVSRDGGTPERVLVTRFDEYSPVWSPDGRWFAFTATDTGTPQIYIRRFPAGARLQVSIRDGTEPVWPRRGDLLFFRSGGNLVASRVIVGDTFDVAPPEMVLADAGDPGTPVGLPNYDVAPDAAILQVRSRPRVTSASHFVVVLPLTSRS
jgi:serine/threonine-protein kinase